MAEARNILSPSDASSKIGALTLSDSMEYRLEQYKDNQTTAYNALSLADGTLQTVNEHLREIKILTLQASNDTLTSKDRVFIAQTINVHLDALKDLANIKTPNQSYLFAGAASSTSPFAFSYTAGGELGETMLLNADYRGAYENRQIYVSNSRLVPITLGGFDIFQVEPRTLRINNYPGDYVAPEDSVFYINGKSVQVFRGDSVDLILERINNSLANVKAYRDLVDNSLVIEAQSKTDLAFFEENSSVLQNIGLIDDLGTIRLEVMQSGRNIFQVIINLRDNIINGRTDLFRGTDLDLLDTAQDAVLEGLTKVGALQSYFKTLMAHGEQEAIYLAEIKKDLDGFDMASAITEYHRLNRMQSVLYYIGSSFFKSSLLNYIS